MAHSPTAPRPTRNIVLVGFMGCGKSTVGRVLAERTGFGFVDTDAEIVRQAGHPITQIFAEEGEEAFRDRESAVLGALAGRPGLVVATGGGIVLRPENRQRLRRLGFVVWLEVDAGETFRRVSKNRDRPLLHTPDPEGTVRRMLAERAPLYSETCHLRIQTAGLDTAELAYGIRESAEVFFADAS